jgi:cyclase
MTRRLAFTLGLVVAARAASGQAVHKVTELAPGVYAIQHDNRDKYVSGNTTVIIGDRQVFVVDATFLPTLAREDIAQIRQWTNKPVSFLLNTHYHEDHNIGNRVYMDAFPGLTVVAHVETKKMMDMLGPSAARRLEEDQAPLQRMLDTKKTPDGTNLTADDVKDVQAALVKHRAAVADIQSVQFQSATLSFEQGFTVDIGGREVQVKYLGRGNTEGDAVVYLPKEKILVTGDLVVSPIPYVTDGYPTEWVKTLQRLSELDATKIVPGHGPIMHDKSYIFLLHDLMQSAVDQMNAKVTATRAVGEQTFDDVKEGVNLSSFQQRFAGGNQDIAAAFDRMTGDLVRLVYNEAVLR